MGPRTGSLKDSPEAKYKLTRMEAKVIPLLAGGFQQKEISIQLNISINTVKTHLRNAYRKLGVHSEAAAVARFLSHEYPGDESNPE